MVDFFTLLFGKRRKCDPLTQEYCDAISRNKTAGETLRELIADMMAHDPTVKRPEIPAVHPNYQAKQ